MSQIFEKFLIQNGIQRELTIAYSPEQNGVSERFNRTIVETIRTLLCSAKLPKKFWGEMAHTAVYLKNRWPTRPNGDFTPYEMWTGHKPSVGHLKKIGCTTYVHIPKSLRRKLDPKAKKLVLVGYGTKTKGYRMYDPENGKVSYARNCIFDENSVGIINRTNKDEITPIVFDMDEQQVMESNSEDKSESEDSEEETEVPDEEIEIPEEIFEVRRSGRTKKEPDRYGDWTCLSFVEPSTYQEALESAESNEWYQAMMEEYNSLMQNDVWELVEKPNNKKLIKSKWVYKIKKEPSSPIRFKACLLYTSDAADE